MVNVLLVSQRLDLLEQWLGELRRLAHLAPEAFYADSRNPAAAESYLRRCLEAIFDVGRHILAKTGAVDLASEYKSIARGLVKTKAVSPALGDALVVMAGYRNRLVHLDHQVSNEELYDILQNDLADIHRFIVEIKGFLEKTQRKT